MLGLEAAIRQMMLAFFTTLGSDRAWGHRIIVTQAIKGNDIGGYWLFKKCFLGVSGHVLDQVNARSRLFLLIKTPNPQEITTPDPKP